MKLTMLLFTALPVIFLCAASNLQGSTFPGTTTSASPAFLLPDGEQIRMVFSLIPLPEEKGRKLGSRNVCHETLILKSQAGQETVIYQSPSTPYAQTVDTPSEIYAIKDPNRIEVFIPVGGRFTLIRLAKEEGQWRYTGTVIIHDLVSLPTEPADATKVELVNWGTVQATIRDGSLRTLFIDAEGVVRENGAVFQRIKHPKIAPPNEDDYKANYRDSVNYYYEPRDEHGIQIEVVDRLIRARQKLMAQAPSSAQLATAKLEPKNAPEKLQVEENKEVSHANTELQTSVFKIDSSVKKVTAMLSVSLFAAVLWWLYRRSRR